MSGDYYILEGREIIPVDCLTWAKWFERAKNRVIARDAFEDVLVSTVFLGLDHQWIPDLPPLLFETMIFGGRHDQYQARYSTYDEALEGHRFALQLARVPDVLAAGFIG